MRIIVQDDDRHHLLYDVVKVDYNGNLIKIRHKNGDISNVKLCSLCSIYSYDDTTSLIRRVS